MQKSYSFAVETVLLCRRLSQKEKEFVMTKQLTRCSTAVGALIREARCAESRPDFIHKLCVAFKEINESLYWLELIRDTIPGSRTPIESLTAKATELYKILSSSILTAKSKLKN